MLREAGKRKGAVPWKQLAVTYIKVLWGTVDGDIVEGP
jgi:hypothetical protein